MKVGSGEDLSTRKAVELRAAVPIFWLVNNYHGPAAWTRSFEPVEPMHGESVLQTARRKAEALRGKAKTSAEDELGSKVLASGAILRVVYGEEVVIQQPRKFHLGDIGLWKVVDSVRIPED